MKKILRKLGISCLAAGMMFSSAFSVHAEETDPEYETETEAAEYAETDDAAAEQETVTAEEAEAELPQEEGSIEESTDVIPEEEMPAEEMQEEAGETDEPEETAEETAEAAGETAGASEAGPLYCEAEIDGVRITLENESYFGEAVLRQTDTDNSAIYAAIGNDKFIDLKVSFDIAYSEASAEGSSTIACAEIGGLFDPTEYLYVVYGNGSGMEVLKYDYTDGTVRFEAAGSGTYTIVTAAQIYTETVTESNPLYPSDRFNSSFSIKNHGSGEEITETYESIRESLEAPSPNTSVEEAGEDLRARMRGHEEQFYVRFALTEFQGQDSANPTYKQVAAEALQHTGVPTEGDYIRWGYKGYTVTTTYSVINGVYTGKFSYKVTYYDSAEQENALTARLNEIMADLSLDGQPEYTKIRTIHDYICNLVSYDNAHKDDDTYLLKYTPYAAVINGTAVCQGYALLFYRLCLEYGIDCRMIPGTGSNEDHAWNIVKIGTKYYDVDCTWDDTGSYDDIVTTYLLKSEADFRNHVRRSEFRTSAFNAQYPMNDTSYSLPDKVYSYMVKLSDDLVNLHTGGHYTVTARTLPYNAELQSVIWSTGDADVAVVNDNGEITAVGVGIAVITVDSEDGKSTAKFSVMVSGDSTEGFTYTISGTDTVITGTTLTGDTIVIPSEIDGHTITGIGTNAFAGCSNLVSVTIPDTVTRIGDAAFSGCTGLTSITVPVSVTGMGVNVFRGCTGLQNICYDGTAAQWKALINEDLGSETGQIAVVDSSGNYLLNEPSDFRFSFDSSVKKYAVSRYAGTDTEITVPSERNGYPVVGISGEAFAGLDNLTSVTLHDGIIFIGTDAFAGCTSLAAVYYDGMEEDFVALINEELNTIGNIPVINSMGEYVFNEPSDFTFTYNQAFENYAVTGYAGSSAEIEVPVLRNEYPVEMIASGAFAGCEGLQIIHVGTKITSIAADAFDGCGSLKYVYFSGTSAQWTKTGGAVPEGVTLVDRETQQMINNVISRIDAIGPVTLAKESQILAAKDAFDALTEGQQGLVYNSDKLEHALSELQILKVRSLIDAIPEILTPENEAAVGEAREAYDALTDDQKALVDNYQKLTDAEERIDEIISTSSKIRIKGLKDQLEQNYTGSAIKLQGYEVYYGEILLKEGTDYTVKYVSNKDAGTAKMIISLKGSYAKYYEGSTEINFTIHPVDLETDPRIRVDDITAFFNEKEQKANPVVYFNGKKLAAKGNYEVDHPVMQMKGDYTVEITGTGKNFVGTKEIVYSIVSKDSRLMSKTKLSIPDQIYTGDPITIDSLLESGAIAVKDGSTALVYGTDYEVLAETYENNTEIGTASVILKGTGDTSQPRVYVGKTRVTFKIKGTPLQAKWVTTEYTSAVYTGSALIPEVTVTDAAGSVLSEDDFEVLYTNNTNVGTATIQVTGKGAYSGTVKKTFKINKANVNDAFEIDVDETAEYMASGAKPNVVVKDSRTKVVLKEGVAYKLAYANNKAVTDENTKKMPVVKITGLGNYTGTVQEEFEIVPGDSTKLIISAPDIAYANKKANYKTALKVLDAEGKTLNAKNDYDAVFECDGVPLDAASIVEAGSEITVYVTGKGKYSGETIEGTYTVRELKADIKNISSAVVTVDPVRYTGEELEPDVIVKLKDGTLLTEGDDYVIESYANNINPSKAAVVIIRGTGDYSGTKIQKFTILKAAEDTWWSNVIKALGLS